MSEEGNAAENYGSFDGLGSGSQAIDEFLEEKSEEQEEEDFVRAVDLLMSRSAERPAYVSSVHVDGVARTEDWLTENAVDGLLYAKTYAEVWKAAGVAQVNLEDLDVFKTVEFVVDVVPGGKVNELVVTFEVEEKGRLSGGGINLTAGRNEGNANIEFNLNNLTGRADRIDMKSSRSTQSTTTTEVSYKLPLNGDVHWPLTLGYFKEAEVRETSSHTQHTQGLFASYDTYSEFGEHNLRYELGLRNIGDMVDKVSFAVREDAGHSMKSSLKHTLKVDLAKDDEAPETSVLKLETELAGIGGGASFLKNTLDFMYRLPFWDGLWEVGVSCRGGLIHPLLPGYLGRTVQAVVDPNAAIAAAAEVEAEAAQAAGGGSGNDGGGGGGGGGGVARPQISDRFFLGGSWDVRGFGLRSIGPSSKKDALGGDGFWAGALHLYTPLPYGPWRERFGKTLRPHFFVNGGACVAKPAGMSWSDAQQSLVNETSASVGVGLAAKLSSIHIELNMCLPIKVHGTAKPNDVQFGCGIQFL